MDCYTAVSDLLLVVVVPVDLVFDFVFNCFAFLCDYRRDRCWPERYSCMPLLL